MPTAQSESRERVPRSPVCQGERAEGGGGNALLTCASETVLLFASIWDDSSRSHQKLQDILNCSDRASRKPRVGPLVHTNFPTPDLPPPPDVTPSR